MTLVSGAQLFTGNTALVAAAYMEDKIPAKALAKNWVASYTGNLVGAVLLACLAHFSATMPAAAPAAVTIATAKCTEPFFVALTRGILCNWLVCMAVYMAYGCSSMVGKTTAIWFPISGFVAMGFDHCVANMFLIPLGILRGAEITVLQMFTNSLLPVTLGNIIGGAVAAMLPFGLTYGRWFQKKDKSS